MIPLSRPVINYSGQTSDIDDFISSIFPGTYYNLTFSARQGLSEIYQKIRNEAGVVNVAVSPLVCSEAIYPIIENGHHIQFVDIDKWTLNMDEQLVPSNVDALQAIHFGGNPQNMSAIHDKNPSIVIEDCAQCFGTKFQGKQVGLFGNYASFSFMKNIYSLGGGFVLSRNHNESHTTHYKEFDRIPTYYRILKRKLESNCRIGQSVSFQILKLILGLKPENTSLVLKNTSLNQTIISSIENQLPLFSWIIKKRISIALRLIESITNPEFTPQKILDGGLSNYLRLFFILKNQNSKSVIADLRKKGIGANHLTQNLLSPYQQRFDKNKYLAKYVRKAELPNYFDLHDRIISIPITPSMTEHEIISISNSINRL